MFTQPYRWINPWTLPSAVSLDCKCRMPQVLRSPDLKLAKEREVLGKEGHSMMLCQKEGLHYSQQRLWLCPLLCSLPEFSDEFIPSCFKPIESFSYITDNRSGIKRRCLSTSPINQGRKVCGAAVRALGPITTTSKSKESDSGVEEGQIPLDTSAEGSWYILFTKSVLDGLADGSCSVCVYLWSPRESESTSLYPGLNRAGDTGWRPPWGRLWCSADKSFERHDDETLETAKRRSETGTRLGTALR
ncbi:hypothetical protein EYF80_029940 [Liparis tanakae]|uniref:Uncharacterized protein n=1 Tax=Liparis tanakae TaxID=230148 RepID=A0A4Z2H4T7_9TELE|nr:hypothetical protein EYF80_029940 [Liparis tanakae]